MMIPITTSVNQRLIILAGITAAKTLVATFWKQTGSLTIIQWKLSLLDIFNLECSIAKIHGAKLDVNFLYKVIDRVKSVFVQSIFVVVFRSFFSTFSYVIVMNDAIMMAV